MHTFIILFEGFALGWFVTKFLQINKSKAPFREAIRKSLKK